MKIKIAILLQGGNGMKGYKVKFKSKVTSDGYIYCIAENEEKAKEYMEEVTKGKILSVEEVSMFDISMSDLSAGDLIRLIKGC